MTDEVKNLGEPLTIEQLRGMDGEPVLLVFDFELEPMISLIEYVQDANCIILTNNLGGRSEFYSDEELREYGIKVYAYPPAHIDREALCGTWEGEADGYADGELVYDVWRCGDCGYVEETDDPDLLPRFCPSCGRAMTPPTPGQSWRSV